MIDKEIMRSILLIVTLLGGVIINRLISKSNAKQLENESKVYKEICDILQEKKNSDLSNDKYKKIKERLKTAPDEELFHTEAVIDSKLEGNKNDGIIIPTLIVFIQIALKIGMNNAFADHVTINELTDYVTMLVLGFLLYALSNGYFILRNQKYILSLMKREITERKDYNNNIAIHNSINKMNRKVEAEKKEIDISPKRKPKKEIYFSIGFK